MGKPKLFMKKINEANDFVKIVTPGSQSFLKPPKVY